MRKGKPTRLGCHARARTRDRGCRSPAAIGNVCWRHGASGLHGRWTLTAKVTPKGSELRIFPEQGDRKTRRRQRFCLPFAAVELIRRGIVTAAVCLSGQGGLSRFFRRLEREGIGVIEEGGGEWVQRVRFEVPPTAESAAESASEAMPPRRAPG